MTEIILGGATLLVCVLIGACIVQANFNRIFRQEPDKDNSGDYYPGKRLE